MLYFPWRLIAKTILRHPMVRGKIIEYRYLQFFLHFYPVSCLSPPATGFDDVSMCAKIYYWSVSVTSFVNTILNLIFLNMFVVSTFASVRSALTLVVFGFVYSWPWFEFRPKRNSWTTCNVMYKYRNMYNIININVSHKVFTVSVPTWMYEISSNAYSNDGVV